MSVNNSAVVNRVVNRIYNCIVTDYLCCIIEPPSRPIDLQADETTKNSISISWSPPSFLGYRKDLYYTVEHSHPFIPGVMLPALCGNDCLIDTNCTISSLHPATTYAIQVTAHNGVSDQDRDGAFGRQVKITLQTEIARECKHLKRKSTL